MSDSEGRHGVCKSLHPLVTRPTYSASEAAAAVGLSRQGLLSWERRYGFPSPGRTPSGHRRYTNDELMAIAMVRANADRGMPVAEAIEQVRGLGAGASPALEGASDALLRSALDRLPVNVAILRAPDFRYVYLNHSLARLVPEIRVGARIEDILQGIRGIGALQRVVQTGVPWHEPEEAVIIDGQLRFFASTYIRLPALEGLSHHVLGVGWDATEAVKARRRLATAEANFDPGLLELTRSGALLRTLDAVAKAVDGGSQRMFRLLTERICRDLDADGASAADYLDGVLSPRVNTTLTRELRWRAFQPRQSPLLEEALANDSVAWLQASRSRHRDERALLRRLVARTLCCAPVVLDGKPVAALIVRWSLVEHQPTMATVNFLEVARRLAKLALVRERGASQ